MHVGLILLGSEVRSPASSYNPGRLRRGLLTCTIIGVVLRSSGFGFFLRLLVGNVERSPGVQFGFMDVIQVVVDVMRVFFFLFRMLCAEFQTP